MREFAVERIAHYPLHHYVYMDGVVREVYARAEGNGVTLVGVNGRRWEFARLFLQMTQR